MEEGLTLEQWVDNVPQQSEVVVVQTWMRAPVETVFRDDVKHCMRGKRSIVGCNFHFGRLYDDENGEFGHFAPLGGYDEAKMCDY